MNIKKLRPLGVIYDLPPEQLDEDNYSAVTNFTFRQGSAFRVAGYSDGAPDDLTPGALTDIQYLVGNKRPNNQYYWLYPTATGVWATDQTNHFNITPLDQSASEIGKWTGGELNGLMMLCNGINAPWYWDGQTGNAMETLPNFPANTTAGWIRAYKYFAVAGDITSNGTTYDNQIYWSESVDPGLPPQGWSPLPSNDAGDNILASTPGTVIDGHQLRDTFVVAKNHSLYLMTFVGGRFVFNFRKLSESTGALTSNCMVEHQGKLFIFSDGDVMVTDGQSIKSIANDRVRERIFLTMNQASYTVCHAALYSAVDEIWFCYPTGKNEVCDTAAVYDITDDKWGFRELPNTVHTEQGIVSDEGEVLIWDTDTQEWDSDPARWDETGLSEIADGLMMATQTKLYAIGKSESFDGLPVNASIEKLSMDFGSLERQKLFTELWLYAAGTKGDVLTIRVGVQDHEGDDINWGVNVPFVIGVDDKVNGTLTGRLISVRIEAELDTVWSVRGFDIMYHDKGRW